MNLISRNNARKDSDIQKGHAQNTNRKHGHAVGTDVNDYEAKLLEDSHKDLHASETEIKEYTKSLREPRPKYSEPSFGKLRTREFTSFGGDEKYGQDLYADDLDQRSKLLKALSSQVKAPAKEDFSNEARKFRDSLYELGLEKFNKGMDFYDQIPRRKKIEAPVFSALNNDSKNYVMKVAKLMKEPYLQPSLKPRDVKFDAKEIINQLVIQIKSLFIELLSDQKLLTCVFGEIFTIKYIGDIALNLDGPGVDLSKSKNKVKQKNQRFIRAINPKIEKIAEKLITISQDNSIYKEDASPQQIKTLQTKVSAFAEALLEVTPKSFEEYQSSN